MLRVHGRQRDTMVLRSFSCVEQHHEKENLTHMHTAVGHTLYYIYSKLLVLENENKLMKISSHVFISSSNKHK